jgi:DNA-binding cell septation regulator SpoVG
LVTYFDLTKHEIKGEELHFYFTELNEVPKEFTNVKLHSKGFFPEATVQDFPIRRKNVFLHITRRRWLNEVTGKVVTRDWQLVAKGKKGALVAMVKGTKAEVVIKILHKIPLEQRNKIKEITLDMAGNMGLIVKK